MYIYIYNVFVSLNMCGWNLKSMSFYHSSLCHITVQKPLASPKLKIAYEVIPKELLTSNLAYLVRVCCMSLKNYEETGHVEDKRKNDRLKKKN